MPKGDPRAPSPSMPADIIVAEASLALRSTMARVREEIDAAFESVLAIPDAPRATLCRAMRYATIGGGKRLRPLLVTAVAALYGVDRTVAVRVGLGIECVHVYSLIHDDLPAMDDDALRHGKPTLHRAFDEATAILAGDSLHTLAFELLADPETHPDPFVRAELVLALARAAGPSGMAGGQAMDIEAERAAFDLATVTRLQAMKTGALIGAAVEAGLILGRVPPEARTPLRGYARDIGLAFQIADDLLDAGEERQGGRSYVDLLGEAGARAELERVSEQALHAVAEFPRPAPSLAALVDWNRAREK